MIDEPAAQPTPNAPKRRAVNPYVMAGAPLAFVVAAVPVLSVIAAWNGWVLPEQLWQGWNVCIGGLIALNLRVGLRGDDRDGGREKCNSPPAG
jgi:hypothetical protein